MGWTLAIAGLGLLGFELWLRIAFGYAARGVYSGVPELRPRKVESDSHASAVAMMTADGVRLAGHYWPGDGHRFPTVVFAPESGASGLTAVHYAAPLLQAGVPVLAVDFRNTQDSDAEHGYRSHHWPTDREVRDVTAAIDKAVRLAGVAGVAFLGVSKGAAAGMIAAVERTEVSHLAVVSAFDTHDVARTFGLKWAFRVLPRWVDRILPRWHVAQTIRLGGAWEAWVRGVRYPSVRRSLDRLRDRSLLFITGSRDSYVPRELVESLTAAAARHNRVQCWTVPKSKHNQARDTDTAEYDRRLLDFFADTADGVMEPQGELDAAGVRLEQ